MPGFEAKPGRVDAETSLRRFVKATIELALEKGLACVVIGDISSIVCPRVDSWHGSHVFREASLVGTLLGLDAVDTFRERHPDPRAFSYFTRPGSASRLGRVPLGQRCLTIPT